MPRQIRYEDEDARPGTGGIGSAFRALVRAAVTLVVLAAMLYGAAMAISRTGGFRSYVQAEISTALGFEVAVGETKLTPGFVLVIDGIAAGRFDAPGTPCVRADRLTVGWSPVPSGGTRLRSVSVETGLLAFAQGPEGDWAPKPLAGVAEAIIQGAGLGLDEIRGAVRAKAGSAPSSKPAGGTATAFPVQRVVVRGMDVVWWKADKSKLASLAGLNVQVTPVEVPGRRMIHILADATSFERTGGEWISPLRVECLWGGGERIVLNAAAGASPVPAAGIGPIPGLEPPATTPREP
jgi:hypothetical protein